MSRTYLQKHQLDVLDRSCSGGGLAGAQGCAICVANVFARFWSDRSFPTHRHNEAWWIWMMQCSVEAGDRLKTNQPNVDRIIIDAVSPVLLGAKSETFTALCQEDCEVFLDRFTGIPCTIAITAVPETSEAASRETRSNVEVGDTFGIVSPGNRTFLFDIHRHYDPDGQERGMLQLLQTENNYRNLSAWIYKFLLPCMRCSVDKQLDIHVITSPEERRHRKEKTQKRGALPYRKEKTQLLTKIGSIACIKCGIARPSKDARSHIAETWYRRLCGYCHSGHGVRGEDWAPSRLEALTSIRCRALAELEQASEHLSVVCGATRFKLVQLTRAIAELRRMVTPKRLRQSGKPTVPAVALAGQLVRTQFVLHQHGGHQTQLDAIDAALSLMAFK